MRPVKAFAAKIETEREQVIAALAAPTVPCAISCAETEDGMVSLTCTNCGPVAECLPGYVGFMMDRHFEN